MDKTNIDDYDTAIGVLYDIDKECRLSYFNEYEMIIQF